MICRAALLWMMLAAPVAALDLSLPASARLTAERNTAPDRYAAPVGVFEDGTLPVITVEGEVRRAAWRLESAGLTPLQVMRPLRAQLEAAGLTILLDCDAAACGGFDFRFATETLPGPNMYVNIRAYHFVTAVRGLPTDPSDVVTVLASTSTSAAFVQIVQAGALDAAAVVAPSVDSPAVEPPAALANLTDRLLRDGHVVLNDLEFDTGASDLGTGPFPSLEELAAFLAARSGVRIALVGHTDSVGSLASNIALSKARARSVRQRLISTYGVPEARIEAEGMGYLAPVASNLNEVGRDANRRVEVILLSEN